MSWLLKFQSIGLLDVWLDYQTVITELEGREELVDVNFELHTL